MLGMSPDTASTVFILLNFVVFLFTNSSLQQDGKATGEGTENSSVEA